MRRGRLSLALLLLVWGCGDAGSRPTNLVLVVVDTLRQDRVHAYGYAREQTPFLDRLAAEGCRADGRAPSSWTRPSTATLLTGLHPLRHQVISPNDLVPESAPLLAERFMAAGFATAAVIGNSVVSQKWGFGRGFGTFVDVQQELARVPRAEELNRRLGPVLDGLEPPFFLYVHYMDPHLPYDPGRGWDGGPLTAEGARHAPITEEFFDAAGDLSVEERRRLAGELYDGEVRRADDGVRALWEAIAARGLTAGTLLVVTSDHGEELLEHGGFSHGRTLYEEVLRVPLLLRGAGIATRCGGLGVFPLEDLAPTLAALFDLPANSGEARSGPAGRDRSAALRAGAERPGARGLLAHLDFAEGAALAYRSGDDKILLGELPYKKEWFDLAADPEERRNLLLEREPSAVGETLARELAASYNELSRAALSRSSTQDPEIVAQLRALGYLGAAAKPRHDRRFPSRIGAADALPGGLRGWERSRRPGACARRDGSGFDQELYGWRDLAAGTGTTLGLFLERPADLAARLEIRGVSGADRSVELAVAVDGVRIGAAPAMPGELDLAFDASLDEGRDPVVVEIRVEGPSGGAGTGAASPVSIESVCLVAP